MREGADVERVSSLSRRAPLLLAMHERALPPMRSRELVRRIWEHGQPVLWAKIGIAAEPLIDARRVEDVGARQAARAVSYLEVSRQMEHVWSTSRYADEGAESEGTCQHGARASRRERETVLGLVELSRCRSVS